MRSSSSTSSSSSGALAKRKALHTRLPSTTIDHHRPPSTTIDHHRPQRPQRQPQGHITNLHFKARSMVDHSIAIMDLALIRRGANHLT
ncbi:hypothetical protein DFQ26_001948, partial [Actinomortierella ambigua]